MTASRPLLAFAAILILASGAAAGAAPFEMVRQSVHVIAAGETLWSISQMHRTTPSVLARLNGLADESRIQMGQMLQVSGRLPPGSSRTPGSPAALASRARLAWPSRGVITSRFEFRGRRHHHGIDIAAPVGTPIRAARDGVVQFAGWKGAYGALVILDHGGGLTTWYGHASKLLLGVGERVRRGQIIAQVGTTGRVTGPNLHFEVRRNDAPLDPLRFLQIGLSPASSGR